MSEPLDAFGVPLEQRRRDCAAGLHFFMPEHNGFRRCAHCRVTVNADQFFVEAAGSLIERQRRE